MLYDSNIIAFPGLGLEFDINPVAFTVFGREIMWYGILMAAGILLGLLTAIWVAKKSGVSEEDIIDLVLWAIPAAIVGARAYYVIFNLDRYRTLYDMIAVWNGGLAIYGSIIAGALVALVFTKLKRINRGKMLDVLVFGLLVGQVIGRFGNFTNREAYGAPFSGLLRMEIFDKTASLRMSVHPTFLYESAWNLLGLILLLLYFNRRKMNGETFLMYVGWYGLGRGFIEGLRTDSLYFMGTGVRVSQVLGFASFLAALGLLTFFYAKKRYQTMKAGIGVFNHIDSPYRLEKEKTAGPAEGLNDIAEANGLLDGDGEGSTGRDEPDAGEDQEEDERPGPEKPPDDGNMVESGGEEDKQDLAGGDLKKEFSGEANEPPDEEEIGHLVGAVEAFIPAEEKERKEREEEN